MSWKIVNQIIGLASIDLNFQKKLQQDPEAALAAQGIDLPPEELEVLRQCATLPFPQFCQRLQEIMAPDEHSSWN